MGWDGFYVEQLCYEDYLETLDDTTLAREAAHVAAQDAQGELEADVALYYEQAHSAELARRAARAAGPALGAQYVPQLPLPAVADEDVPF